MGINPHIVLLFIYIQTYDTYPNFLQFLTTASSKNMFVGNCNNDNNKKWPSKPEILTSQHWNSNSKSGFYDHWQLMKTAISISGCQSLMQSPGHFHQALHGWKRHIFHWNFDPICHISSGRLVLVAILLFVVVYQCCFKFGTLPLCWPWSKTLFLQSNYNSTYFEASQQYKLTGA